MEDIEEITLARLQAALVMAGRIGEHLAQLRAEDLRRQAAADRQQAAELAARHAAELRLAQARLAAVHTEGWWASTSPDAIVALYETAAAWPDDRLAGDARRRIEVEVAKRFQVTPDALRGRMEAERQAAEQAQNTPGRADQAVATVAAEQADQQATKRADYAHDSAERRAADTARMRAAGIAGPVIEAAMVADQMNATSPAAAVGGRGRTTGKPRKVRSAARGKTVGAELG